jgi:hypothetical protein
VSSKVEQYKIARWIVALPCIHFSVKEREIINKYGFMSFPQFLDNHYVKENKAKVSFLIKNIKRYDVKFAIAPDYQYENALLLKKLYPHVNWIFPLHRKVEKEIALQFEWVGFPHRAAFRDYSLEWFLANFEHKNRWYLGFWAERDPYLLFAFDGFDTTIPETFSGKYGRIWLDWGKNIKANGMKTIEIFEQNVRNFKQAIYKLESQISYSFESGEVWS